MLITEDQILLAIDKLPPTIRARVSLDISKRSPKVEAIPRVASVIDHTLLKADANLDQYAQLCQEAVDHGFFSVCVPPNFISFSKKKLKDTSVKVCSVIGFPLGNQTSSTKTFECRNALELGADEIDMVIQISALKSKKFESIFQEIETLKQVCGKKILKCIIETALLSPEEIVQASFLCRAAGADFVKTSTGFSSRGASVEDIELIRVITQEELEIKASGGIKTSEDAKRLLLAGASRLGCSSGVKILNKQIAPEGEY